MAAGQRLELGFLVRADHEVVLAERLAVPAAGVEVQHPGGLGGEVRVPGEDPRPVTPRLDGVGPQPAPHCRGRHALHQTLGHRLGSQLRELVEAAPALHERARTDALAAIGRLDRQLEGVATVAG
jgi:hypothetical protein